MSQIQSRANDFSRAAALQHKLRTGVNSIVGYLRVISYIWQSSQLANKDVQPLMTQTKLLMSTVNNSRQAENDNSATIDLSSCLFSNNQLQMLNTQSKHLLKLINQFSARPEVHIESSLSEPSIKIEKVIRQLISYIDLEIKHGKGESSGSSTMDLTSDSINHAVNTLKKSNKDQKHPSQGGTILLADDDEFTRDVLTEHLKENGFRVVTAENGAQAIKAIQALAFDLVLLDIIMPEKNGYEVLEHIKNDDKFKDIPVIVISAFNKTDSITHCIELGADDYLTKPIVPKLLFARMNSSLEKNRLRNKSNAYLKQIDTERKRANDLLLNILPPIIAKRLGHGQKTIADHFKSVTVMFCDIVGFTEYSSSYSADEVVGQLNIIFEAFDMLVIKHGVEKIKTIGDGYLAVSGLPAVLEDHAQRAANLSLEMLEILEDINRNNNSNWKLRIGLNSGPVTAGVIGKYKFAYDVWGDTVNVASRMESNGKPGRIQVSESTYLLLKSAFQLESRGTITVKGKGEMNTWFLNSK